MSWWWSEGAGGMVEKWNVLNLRLNLPMLLSVYGQLARKSDEAKHVGTERHGDAGCLVQFFSCGELGSGG